MIGHFPHEPIGTVARGRFSNFPNFTYVEILLRPSFGFLDENEPESSEKTQKTTQHDPRAKIRSACTSRFTTQVQFHELNHEPTAFTFALSPQEPKRQSHKTTTTTRHSQPISLLSHNYTMSSNDQEREIVEDTPHYRSVMIAGPLSAPPMPRSFASVRPFKTAPQSLKHEKPIISGAAVWSVADLPSLPAAYFLERSSVYVEGDAQEIANRICDCLRKQSIAASCDGDDKVRMKDRSI